MNEELCYCNKCCSDDVTTYFGSGIVCVVCERCGNVRNLLIRG